jgi:hypothetical protein
MLVFHSHCQMGNQMFIYACAKSLSKKRNIPYCLSEIDKLKFFELSQEDYSKNKRKYFRFKLLNKLKLSKFKFEHYQDNRIDYSERMFNEKHKTIWYYGYFQSENYFYDNQQEIRKSFEIKQEYKNEFANVKNKLSLGSDYISVHIRLKDYKTFGPDFLDGPDLSLPFSYYHQLLLNFKNTERKIVIMSDEPQLVKKEFEYLNNAIYSEESPIVDFQIIKNAQICINANSTFSWWAAWLNERKDKQIFVPNHFLGFKVKKEFPVNIIPSAWHRQDVY